MSYAIRAENAELKEELALLREDYAAALRILAEIRVVSGAGERSGDLLVSHIAGLRRAKNTASFEPTE